MRKNNDQNGVIGDDKEETRGYRVLQVAGSKLATSLISERRSSSSISID